MLGYHRHARTAALMALVAVAVTGCAAARQETLTRYDNPGLAAELKGRLEAVRPQSFSAVHRAVLCVRGREYVIAGYVRGDSDGTLRLRATGDMGGAFFDVAVPPMGEARVVENPGPMRDSWVLRGAARDIAVMYGLKPSAAAALVRFDNGEVGFADDAPGGVRREFRFDPESHCFVRYAAVKYRRLIYEARFSDARLSSGWPAPQPRRVFITDSALGYSLDVRVVEMRAADGG